LNDDDFPVMGNGIAQVSKLDPRLGVIPFPYRFKFSKADRMKG